MDLAAEIIDAARYGEIEELQQLVLDHQTKITNGELLALRNTHGCTALHYAAANGHAQIVKFISTCCDLASLVNFQNHEGNTALHWAAVNGHVTIVEELLNHQADPNLKNAAGHTALYEAECADKEETVQLLIRHTDFEAENAESDSEDQEGVVETEDVSSDENVMDGGER